MKNLNGLDIAVFVVYMAAVLAVGTWAARRGKQTKRDYFLSGDKLPWWMIGGSIVASNISSHHLVGVMGTAYKHGFVSIVIEWGAILIGFNALLWVFLPFYLRNGFYTMPEFLERRFGTAARVAYGGLVLLTYVFVEISAVLYLGRRGAAHPVGHRHYDERRGAGPGHGGVYDRRRAAGRDLDRDAATGRPPRRRPDAGLGHLPESGRHPAHVGLGGRVGHLEGLAHAPAGHRQGLPLDHVSRRRRLHQRVLLRRQPVHRAAARWRPRTNGTPAWEWSSPIT